MADEPEYYLTHQDARLTTSTNPDTLPEQSNGLIPLITPTEAIEYASSFYRGDTDNIGVLLMLSQHLNQAIESGAVAPYPFDAAETATRVQMAIQALLGIRESPD